MTTILPRPEGTQQNVSANLLTRDSQGGSLYQRALKTSKTASQPQQMRTTAQSRLRIASPPINKGKRASNNQHAVVLHVNKF
jgi:hypothetical protein